MKAYKKLMDVITWVENLVLVLSSILLLALTFINVIMRYVLHNSLGFAEEIVVAVFVLLSLLAAGVAARTGGLVNLALLPEHVGPKAKKVLHVISTILCVIYSLLMAYEGWGRMQADVTSSPILHIPKTVFWSFVLIGGISLALHFVENCIDFCMTDLTKKEEEE